MPSVSLIVPCHNNTSTLERAVASGLAQEALLELIIVDDCSTDDSAEVAKRLGHSKISHTLNLYSHAIPDYDKEIPNIIEKIYAI